jgi:RNA recognition motif-containing protein
LRGKLSGEIRLGGGLKSGYSGNGFVGFSLTSIDHMRLYVGNLSFNTTQENLRGAFARFGTVSDAMIMTDRDTGQARGFGFVTMSSAEEGAAAMNGLHEKDLDGRNITVTEARPREVRGGVGPRSFNNDRRPSSGPRR